MCINAALALAGMVLAPSAGGDHPFGHTPVPAIIDVVIGVMLLRGQHSVLGWAMVRVVLGGLLFGVIHAMQGDYFGVALQAALSGSMLALLTGNASQLRINVATGVFGLYGLFALLGLLVLTGTGNPLTGALGRIGNDLESEPVSEVTGKATAYKMSFPKGWYLRKQEAALQDNPLADRWAVRADLDAHVFCIVEKVELGPDSVLDLDALTEVVLDNLRESGSDFVEIGRAPLAGVPSGRLIHSTINMKPLGPIHYVHGVIPDGAHAYQVVAFARASQWGSVGAELESIVKSFRLPTMPLPPMPL